MIMKNPPISKKPEQRREIGKDPTNTTDEKSQIHIWHKWTRDRNRVVSEDGLHVVFYPEEHPSDEYQENEWIMEMHIVRYFETSRKFQE